MTAKVVHLLQQRKPNAPQEWLKKLPQMAKRLEESLYRAAASFDECIDAGTLKNRLQQLAVNIGMKTIEEAAQAQETAEAPPVEIWQSDDDQQDRRKMIELIVHSIRQCYGRVAGEDTQQGKSSGRRAVHVGRMFCRLLDAQRSWYTEEETRIAISLHVIRTSLSLGQVPPRT